MAVPLDREANFLAFEKKNNRLMAALRQPEYADVMEFIRARRATVIAPQNETLKEIPMNRSFIETHVIDCFTSEGDNTADNATTDESAEEQKLDAFVSVNGVRGVFTTPEKEALHVLAGPPSDPEEVVAVVTDTASRFAPGSVLSSYVANTRDTSDDVYVLRHTQVTIGDVNADFMIISRPLTFEKCPWEIDEFGAGMLLPTDSHLSDSTQGDSQSVPAIETPPPSYATQAHTGATAGGDLISFDDTNSSIASAGMEHPTASAASELSAVPVTGDAGKAVRPLSRGSSITDGRDGGKDSRRKRESSLSSFKESMRDPSCHGFVRMIRAFCDDMETHPPTIVDMQSRYIAFTVTMEEKFSTHPLFKDSMESTMESLEKPPEDEEIDTWLGRRIDMLTFLTPENLGMDKKFGTNN
ncbi:hypothetical protein SARC_00645 [Sphaeroforma arctica JP610]|uniref:Uncharacterized protein n=1 Tax=Sphaeroforma arctica JP610 TaxID=667725 RepID=A0A0L0GE85_9EUKA|nr:hypothetical protein SARC_00645 [Sphaeroforma arctica JP610]KNC87209.1 hypothetical protein SARC_00645 [Sphaeroforma arctica JP610]|eukprot:XP_014161111.1 hypothetical protein SARC_00645 [Sphaeroforma arctica JP610]